MQSNRNLFRIIFGYLLMFVVYSCLTLLIIQAVVAKPGPSPAGGGYLTLKNDDDFVSTVKPWFPEKEFEQLTIEAWVYFDALPIDGSYWSIFGQEGRFDFVLYNWLSNVMLGNNVLASNANCIFVMGGKPILPKVWKNRWIHIFASYSAAVGWGIDGYSSNSRQGGSILKSNKPFRIGGLVANDRFRLLKGENVKLQGYIDEVRVSDIVRYNPFFDGNFDVPDGKLKSDEHTIGLWHFDGGNAFKDESGNDYTLWKNEAYAVQRQDKMPIVWGKIKEL